MKPAPPVTRMRIEQDPPRWTSWSARGRETRTGPVLQRRLQRPRPVTERVVTSWPTPPLDDAPTATVRAGQPDVRKFREHVRPRHRAAAARAAPAPGPAAGDRVARARHSRRWRPA